MLNICDSELCEPLSVIYKNCIDSGLFPDIWKRSHIIPTCKKSDKQIISNYHPVFLSPICSKIFEHIHDPVFLYLENNEVHTPHQSGFHPNYSCTYQLISVVHNIYADLIITQHLKLQEIFLISQKSLIKYDMKDCYTNLNLLVYKKNF